MYPRGHVTGERPLSIAPLRLTLRLGVERFDLGTRQQREVPEIAADVSVVCVDPELIELVRGCLFCVEPDSARFGLAEFRSRGRRYQWERDAMRFGPRGPPNQLDARGNVAPLVAAAHLEGDAA